MRDHPEPPPLPPRPFEWGPPTHVLLARGRSVGLAFHCSGADRPRTVLLGPVSEADGWLDGLGGARGHGGGPAHAVTPAIMVPPSSE